MGYCIKMTDSNFSIKSENFAKALEALKGAFKEENMTISDASGKHFSWVSTKRVLDCDTLEKALEEIRYLSVYDENGDICNLVFTGQKYGDEDVFFNALAPYVEAGSYLCFEGEDGDIWTWAFSGGKVAYLG